MPDSLPRARTVAAITTLLLLTTSAAAPAKSMRGTEKSDKLFGTPRADVIRGLGGSDVIDGRRGRDRLIGGRGADRIVADDRDRVEAGPGRDTVWLTTSGAPTRLHCGTGRDTLIVTGTTAAAARKWARSCEKVTVTRPALPPDLTSEPDGALADLIAGPAPIAEPAPPGVTLPPLPPVSVADSQPPSVPQGMAWTTITQTSIGVRWDPSSDNLAVTGYRIYRGNSVIATTTATSYTVTGLECGTSYTIGLTAIDAAGNESNRAQATGTTSTQACSTPAPPDPHRDAHPDPHGYPHGDAHPDAHPDADSRPGHGEGLRLAVGQ